MSKSKTKENNEKKLFKIITLGDSGVGKTCILRRFVTGKFDKNTLSMIGFETSSKEIVLKDGTKVALQLIDTAGQENYHALATTYIRNSDGVWFVFSHDSRESFNNIKKWLTSFKDNNQNIDFDKEFPAFLVGNKCDLEHTIDDFEIDNVKNEHNFYGYADTSAKDGIGIDDVFSEMSELLVRIKGKKDQKQNVITIDQYRKKRDQKRVCCLEKWSSWLLFWCYNCQLIIY